MPHRNSYSDPSTVIRGFRFAMRYSSLSERKRLWARTPKSRDALPAAGLCGDDLLVTILELDLDNVGAQPNRHGCKTLNDAPTFAGHEPHDTALTN
jgi:hypothetical protein